MADITITIDDAHVARALAAICTKYNYTDNQLEGGETQAAFAKRMLADWVKQLTLRMEAKTARDAAEAAVEEIDAT
jgi:hypothetical protein